MTIAYLGLGANLGNARQTLHEAAACVAQSPRVTALAASSLYRSAPVNADGGDYLNGVIEIETALPARALLALCQQIEAHFGRQRPYPNAPRTLDLDILLYGDARLAEADLAVPHPRLTERAFALMPLLELNAALVIPGHGRADVFLPGVLAQRIEKLAARLCLPHRAQGGGECYPNEWRRLSMNTPPSSAPLTGSPLVRAPHAPAPFHYLAIEGPIGVGKTSLAPLLAAHWSMQTLLEQPADNPFLERFYCDGVRYALPSQLYFMLQRADQMKTIAAADPHGPPLVADFIPQKDQLFAQLILPADEFALYRLLAAQINRPARTPERVIYLRASPQTLLARIRKRAIPMELSITINYLQALCEAYDAFFYHYHDAPLLTVNTEHWHPLDQPADCARLLERLKTMRNRKEYLTPDNE